MAMGVLVIDQIVLTDQTDPSAPLEASTPVSLGHRPSVVHRIVRRAAVGAGGVEGRLALHQFCDNFRTTFERSVNWAFVSDFQQSGTLILIELAF